MSISATVDLEQALNDFDPAVRHAALVDLLARHPEPPPPRDIANLHCHTFFSFNALGLAPTGLAWLARQQGIDLMGIVDFDVLDAVSEFLEASDLAGVRGSAGIETRTHVPEFMDREINSPGEPGVLYHMAVGFTTTAIPPAAQAIVDELRSQSAQRNRSLVARVNAYLKPVEIDYEADVLPLTPAGTPPSATSSSPTCVPLREFSRPRALLGRTPGPGPRTDPAPSGRQPAAPEHGAQQAHEEGRAGLHAAGAGFVPAGAEGARAGGAVWRASLCRLAGRPLARRAGHGRAAGRCSWPRAPWR